MIIREVYPEEKKQYNQVVNHPLQAWEWGAFRNKTGVDVFRLASFENKKITNGVQFTIHQLPKVNYTVGYIPKCNFLGEEFINAIKKIGEQENTIFFKFEPNICKKVESKKESVEFKKTKQFFNEIGAVKGRSLFTPYTFQIDLKQDEEDILMNMKSKTRYNVRYAKRNGVEVSVDDSDQAFEKYLQLMGKTTSRQGFYAHSKKYHKQMWKTLNKAGIAHLLKATYQDEILVTWIVFVFNNVIYYPYGASSRKHRRKMPSNRMMWEVIKYGKKLGCETFDMWGSLGPNPDPDHPWYGFHRFKEGYNPTLVKFVGTYDLVLDSAKYKIYTLLNNLRWKWLDFKKQLPFVN